MRLRYAVIAFVVVSCAVVALVSILPPTFQLINSSEDDTRARFTSAVATLSSAVDNFIVNTQTFPQKVGNLYAKGSLNFRDPAVIQPAFTTLLDACGQPCTALYFGLQDDFFLYRDRTSWCQPLPTGEENCCDMTLDETACNDALVPSGYVYRPTQRPWYPVLATQPTWSALYVDFSSGGFAATVGAPMIAPDGTLLGAMAVDVTFKPLADLLASMKLVESPSAWALFEAHTNYLLDSSVGLRSSSELLTLTNLSDTSLGSAIADLSADELAVNGSLVKESGNTLSRRFVSVVKVGNVTGVNLRVIVVFIEDPSGAKKDSIILSSSLTAAAVVVGAVLIAVLAIVFFERPLNEISEGIGQAVARAMGLTKIYNDDNDTSSAVSEAPLPGSHITELQDITDSFEELVDELKRIRAFVPKSCLVANADDLEDLSDAQEETTGGVKVAPGRDSDNSSNRSRPRGEPRSQGPTPPASMRRASLSSVSAPTVPAARHPQRSNGPQLYTGKSLHNATVTYLCVQIRGLTEALEAMRDHKVGYDALGLLADCCDVVSSRFNGVIDVYNGDRVTIAFNGMKPNAAHRRCAAECVVVLSSLVRTLSVGINGSLKISLNKRTLEWQHATGGAILPDTNRKSVFPLGISAGIATSRALVGNVGSANLARFSVLGGCVRAALAEELKCSAMPTSIQCLCDRAYQLDIAQSVAYQRVDLATIAPMRLLMQDVSNVNPSASTDDGEWMYELHRAQQANEFNDINEAFDAFAKGDVSEARAKLVAARGRQDADVAEVGIACLDLLLK